MLQSHCIHLKCRSHLLGCAQCLQKCVILLRHSTLGSSLISWWLCEGSQCFPQAPGWQSLTVLLAPNLRDCLPACVCSATLLSKLVLACIYKNTATTHTCMSLLLQIFVCACTVNYIYACPLQSLDLQFAQSEMISLRFLTAKVFSFKCKLYRY